MFKKACLIATLAAVFSWPLLASANDLLTTKVNNYGVPSGLIDLPTAEMAPDAQLSISVAHFEGYTRNTATFQLLPWLSGSFRYIGVDGLSPAFRIYYDRSFDFRIRLVEESDFLPGIAVGLQDFLGTGVLSSEYVVATKQFGNRLRLTGGVGWGRLGSYNSFATLGNRAPFSFAAVGTGGNFRISDYFSGDMALFGGFSYDITDKLSFSAEYSSDNYDFENQQGVFTRGTPWNFAIGYQPNDDVAFRLFSVHGKEVGLSVTVSLNVRKPPVPAQEPAPLPVAVRSPESLNDLGWTLDPEQQITNIGTLSELLAQDRVVLEGFQIGPRTAHVRIRNPNYLAEAQVLGRTFRVMSRALPGSIETFHITVVENGVPLMTTTMNRSDLERLEHEKEDQALLAVKFTDSLRFGDIPDPLPGTFPQFTWRISPFARFYTFDPERPFRADMRLRMKGEWDLGRGWLATASTSMRLFGNLDRVNRPSNSLLPHVRTNKPAFNFRFGPTVDVLTVAKYARIAPDFYGRFTVGYLEMMYAGASGEVLWKPVDSRLALGAEVNFVRPRASDQRFELASRRTPGGIIPQWNGHVSAYYDFNSGFDATIHAGRYLAGDWGATLEVSRRFANGWRIGAFATRTNVSAAQFGEGSFDKGIFFTIPFSWLLGLPNKQGYSDLIRPIQRDGGQRVDVSGRLYDIVSEPQRSNVAKSWGKFWR